MYGNAYDNRQHFSEYFHQYMKKISELSYPEKRSHEFSYH